MVLELLVLKGRMPPRGDSHGSTKVEIGPDWLLMPQKQQAKVGLLYWPE